MTLPDLVHHNPIRFSMISCVTEDSMESSALATPLDASPPPPPSNIFSIINIVNDDPLPNLRAYPAIASTYTTRRRRAQTSPRPVPPSIMMNNIPQQQPIMIYDNDSTITNTNTVSIDSSEVANNTNQTTTSASKISKFWPRIKRMMMSTNNNNNNNTDKMKQLFESMNITTNNDDNSSGKSETKLQEQNSNNNKRWLGRNRARVGPQR